MKKLLAFIVVAVLAFSMSVSAFAEGVTPSGGSTGDVNVKIDTTDIDENPVDPENPIYHVVIAWGNLDFTYKISSMEWDTENHYYPGNWDHTSADIKVTNHSNAGVNVASSFPSGNTAVKQSVTATLTNYSFALATAVGTASDNAPNNSTTVTVTGKPDTATDYKIDTVTVAISTQD